MRSSLPLELIYYRQIIHLFVKIEVITGLSILTYSHNVYFGILDVDIFDFLFFSIMFPIVKPK